ncbi:CCDC90 family protein [Candidatus Deianiraea vastatrix]|uniref:DUF1640 domain-containing protein n=1 Tax=Candidatus Deianiraea vastatrix TaxID=2163644 RepID=A0A5B8XHQ8_9RICK|nr:hypothetical protein [Candidatus Deianiraea vastatrix]QED23644.1 hypothetical protein Deia_00857 [Candidatus Deianiraea vastatrix]
MQFSFDTLRFVEILTKNNTFTDAQAKNIINVLKEIEEKNLNILATKRDLREYYYKTIIAIGVMMTSLSGLIIAILNK